MPLGMTLLKTGKTQMVPQAQPSEVTPIREVTMGYVRPLHFLKGLVEPARWLTK